MSETKKTSEKKIKAKKPDSVQTKKTVSSENSRATSASSSDNTAKVVAIVVAVLLGLCILCFCCFIFLGLISEADSDNPRNIDRIGEDYELDAQESNPIIIDSSGTLDDWLVEINSAEIVSNQARIDLAITNLDDDERYMNTFIAFELKAKINLDGFESYYRDYINNEADMLDASYSTNTKKAGTLVFDLDDNIDLSEMVLVFSPTLNYDEVVYLELQ